MEANEGDDPPPIEPAQKTVLRNETPAFVSNAFSHAVMFMENYGWYVVFGIIVAAYIWSKLRPIWQEWEKKLAIRNQEENVDPVLLAQTHENMELSRKRMQEVVNAKAAEYAERMKTLETQKRKEKIEDWEDSQKGRGRRNGRLARAEYNPMTGGGSGPSYRPPKRGNTGGG